MASGYECYIMSSEIRVKQEEQQQQQPPTHVYPSTEQLQLAEMKAYSNSMYHQNLQQSYMIESLQYQNKILHNEYAKLMEAYHYAMILIAERDKTIEYYHKVVSSIRSLTTKEKDALSALTNMK